MDKAAVFSGLGSDALYSDKYRKRTTLDAATPVGQILVSSLYEVFTQELLESHHSSASFEESIFRGPDDIINPPSAYRQHIVIQHSSLCLSHLLRYLHLNYVTAFGTSGCNYATGLCAGLLPAVAAATSSSLPGFLIQARKVYRLALMIGLGSDEYHITSSLEAATLYVDSMTLSELLALVGQHRKDTSGSLYIGAKLSDTSFTLIGTVSEVAKFKEKRLADRKVKAANIRSFYHNESMLAPVFQSLLDRYAARNLEFPSFAELQGSIISSADGKIYDAGSTGSLLELVLSEVFLQPVDWTAVDATLEHLGHSAAVKQHSLQISNYGPGYGAGRNTKKLSPSTIIRDVTFLNSLEGESTASTLHADIAIVGMAAQVPEADDCEELWLNLESQRSSCREIPSSRFDYNDFYVDSGKETSGRTLSTKWGNFLSNPFGFDASFFAISPREALSMDPQQRVMLKVAHRALEDAGYVPNSTASFATDTFACYIAAATNDYVENLRHNVDIYYTPGTHRAFLSGRISYFYRWSGPSVTVDTVCSSSITAINQAVRALQVGDCRSALVGGVNVITSPDMHIGLDRAHFLSPSGQCKSFDAAADGYCRAEGCGALILKTVEDALAENDRIIGIITGSELGQSGNATSITHPHPTTQQKLLHRLLQKARTGPDDISVVEAHGTGTKVGDPIEFDSISSAFCCQRTAENPLYVTSHKANIGHCEAASGIIATIKMCLMFKYNRIPPQARLNTINPRILERKVNCVVIPQKSAAWIRKHDRKRLGVVNNLGAAGSIGALLVEEPPDISSVPDLSAFEAHEHILCLSAKTISALQLLQDRTAQKLATVNGTSALTDFCYTLSARRMAFDKRVIATGRNARELCENICKAECINTSRNTKVVFVFSGQGSQYFGMGRALLSLFKPFHDHVMHCHQLLQNWRRPSCLDIIMATAGTDVDVHDSDQLQSFQSALFVLQVGIARLFLSWGIQPLALIGHSLGEYAALVISEIISLENGLRLVSGRAHLLVEHCKAGSTGMLAVNLADSKVVDILKESKEWDSLSIACDNSPNSCVVGGPNKVLSALSARLSSNGTKCTSLDIPFAYHTEHVEVITQKLTEDGQQITLHPAKIPVMLNARGSVLDTGEQLPATSYFAEHCRHKVRFREGIVNLQSKLPIITDALWIEIGPHVSTLPMVRAQINSLSAEYLPSLDRSSKSATTIVKVLQRVVEKGLNILWRRYFEDFTAKPRLVSVPGMPFQEVDYIIPYVEMKYSDASPASVSTSKVVKEEPLPYRFLSRIIHDSTRAGDAVAIYETDMNAIEAHIVGHKVCGIPLCPASVFHELALSATSHAIGIQGQGQSLFIKDAVFSKPLVTRSDGAKVIVTQVKRAHHAAQEYKFEISSKESRGVARTVYCTGSVHGLPRTTIAARMNRYFAESEKMKTRIEGSATQSFNRRTVYDRIFSRVVVYSDLYQSIVCFRLNETANEGVAECISTPPKEVARNEGAYVADPVLIDIILQTSGFLCNMTARDEKVFIANFVEEASLLRSNFDSKFEVRCENIILNGGATAIGNAIAVDSKGVIAAVRGLHFQRLTLSRMKAALSHAMTSPVDCNSTEKATERSQPTQTKHERENQHILTPQPSISRPNTFNQAIISSQMSTHASDKHEDAILEIIAKACNTPSSFIKPSMSLDELGIDSLLMLELEASFQKIGSHQFTSIDFEKCLTVGDISQLISSARTPVHSQASLRNTKFTETTNPSVITKTVSANHQDLVLDIIAKSCDVPKTSIKLSMALEELGVDSLLMLEMEKPFREIVSSQFNAVDFERCITVEDIVDLVKSNEPEGVFETVFQEQDTSQTVVSTPILTPVIRPAA